MCDEYTVDGHELPRVEGWLDSEFRNPHATWLRGEGQGVVVVPGSGRSPSLLQVAPNGADHPEGQALVGCRVKVKSYAAATAALFYAAAPFLSPTVVQSCAVFGGKAGKVLKFDASNNTYEVYFGDQTEWFPACCLTGETNGASLVLVGSTVQMRTAVEIKVALQGTPLEAAEIIPHASWAGIVAQYNPEDGTYLVYFRADVQRTVTRDCFDVTIGAGGDLRPIGAGGDLRPIGAGGDLRPVGAGDDLRPVGAGGELRPVGSRGPPPNSGRPGSSPPAASGCFRETYRVLKTPWTFLDRMRSVSSDPEGQEMRCTAQHGNTGAVEGIFPVSARNRIMFQVLGVEPSKPFAIWLLPADVNLGGRGNFPLLEQNHSIRWEFAQGESRVLWNNKHVGGSGPYVSIGDLLEVTVDNGAVSFASNGTPHPAIVPATADECRFGVSLCGVGQWVRIVAGNRSDAARESTLGQRVNIKPGAEVHATVRHNRLDANVSVEHLSNQFGATSHPQIDVQICPKACPMEGAKEPRLPRFTFTPTAGLLSVLEQLHITPCAGLLAAGGYNSVEALQFATVEHLQYIGMQRPHALLLMVRLQLDDHEPEQHRQGCKKKITLDKAGNPCVREE